MKHQRVAVRVLVLRDPLGRGTQAPEVGSAAEIAASSSPGRQGGRSEGHVDVQAVRVAVNVLHHGR
jgi:hypothetical protein